MELLSSSRPSIDNCDTDMHGFHIFYLLFSPHTDLWWILRYITKSSTGCHAHHASVFVYFVIPSSLNISAFVVATWYIMIPALSRIQIIHHMNINESIIMHSRNKGSNRIGLLYYTFGEFWLIEPCSDGFMQYALIYTSIALVNDLLLVRCQTIIYTKASCVLIGPFWTNFETKKKPRKNRFEKAIGNMAAILCWLLCVR